MTRPAPLTPEPSGVGFSAGSGQEHGTWGNQGGREGKQRREGGTDDKYSTIRKRDTESFHIGQPAGMINAWVVLSLPPFPFFNLFFIYFYFFVHAIVL
jgi:hypothetical protein